MYIEYTQNTGAIVKYTRKTDDFIVVVVVTILESGAI